jgi:hypothetical protein
VFNKAIAILFKLCYTLFVNHLAYTIYDFCRMNDKSPLSKNQEMIVNQAIQSKELNMNASSVESFESVFEAQKNSLLKLFHAYKGLLVLILLYFVLQIWLFNQSSTITQIKSPSHLTFKIILMMVSFSPLFLIGFYFTKLIQRLHSKPDNSVGIFQKVNKLLQIGLIILHFYLLWVALMIEDLLRLLLNIPIHSAVNSTANSLTAPVYLNLGCQITLAMVCFGFIYVYILHLKYLAPFKKRQKALKKLDKMAKKIQINHATSNTHTSLDNIEK